MKFTLGDSESSVASRVTGPASNAKDTTTINIIVIHTVFHFKTSRFFFFNKKTTLHFCGFLSGLAGLTCSLSTEREQVLNSLENTQKSMKKTQN